MNLSFSSRDSQEKTNLNNIEVMVVVQISTAIDKGQNCWKPRIMVNE